MINLNGKLQDINIIMNNKGIENSINQNQNLFNINQSYIPSYNNMNMINNMNNNNNNKSLSYNFNCNNNFTNNNISNSINNCMSNLINNSMNNIINIKSKTTWPRYSKKFWRELEMS